MNGTRFALGIFIFSGIAWLVYYTSRESADVTFTDWLQRSSVIDAGVDVLTNVTVVVNGGSMDLVEQKIQALMVAIASAEGFGTPGVVPTTHHNPGDLGPGDTGYPGDFHSGSFVSQLPDDQTGWNFLHRKISRIVNGTSSAYSLDMTFTEMAQKYAGDWNNWVNNVTRALGISPASTLRQYFFG